MGLREWFNQHPTTTAWIVGGCVVLSLGAVAMQLLGGRRAIQVQVPDTYFSVDDGKTFFAANGANVPPFNYEGKTAVRANVYACGSQKFVAYLDRYTPDAQKILQANKQIPAWVEDRGREVKRPGDPKWVSAGNVKEILPIITVKTPNGMGGAPEPIAP